MQNRHRLLPVLRAVLYAALLAGTLSWATGCSSTDNYERTAERGETELRGVLAITTNAPAATIAMLHSRGSTRPPCRLRALNASVAEDLRTLAAKQRTVIVTGVPRSELFIVTAIREDGTRRRRPAGDEEAAEESKNGFWSLITWGRVPASER